MKGKLGNLYKVAIGFTLIFFLYDCSTPRPLVSSSTRLLKFEEMYIYDNGKDTIIKDFNFYRMLLAAQLIAPSPPPDTFAPGPGSTQLESLMFYQDGSGTTSSHFKRDYQNIYEDHLFAKRKKEYSIYNFKITDDGNISFTRGQYTHGIIIHYSGRVSNDTLYLKLKYEPTNFNFMVTNFYGPADSLRIYVLHPMLK